jgi:hypothetical protein
MTPAAVDSQPDQISTARSSWMPSSRTNGGRNGMHIANPMVEQIWATQEATRVDFQRNTTQTTFRRHFGPARDRRRLPATNRTVYSFGVICQTGERRDSEFGIRERPWPRPPEERGAVGRAGGCTSRIGEHGGSTKALTDGAMLW